MVPGELPNITLTAPDGARATIYQHGAHITSWITPDGWERLFLSERSEFRPGAAIRGGVPVIFPQFAGLGPLPKHGFARITPWDYVGGESGDSTNTARFQLRDSEGTQRIWEHNFLLDLAVTVGGQAITMALHVTNTGPQPLTFTAALHTYLRVSDIASVVINGLEELAYREFEQEAVQPPAPLSIEGEIDRIYGNVPGPVTVHDTNQAFQLSASGFPDVVVWNPGPEKGPALPDMAPGGYRQMVCIEAAVIGQPVTLLPGGLWSGQQTITVLSAAR